MKKQDYYKLESGDFVFLSKKENAIADNVGFVTLRNEATLYGRTLYGEFVRNVEDCRNISRMTEDDKDIFFRKVSDITHAIKELHQTEDVLEFASKHSKYIQGRTTNVGGAYYAGFYDAILALSDGLSLRELKLDGLAKSLFDKIPSEVKSEKK